MICFYTWASIFYAYFPAVPGLYLLQSPAIRGLCLISEFFCFRQCRGSRIFIPDLGSRFDKIPNPGSGSTAKNLSIFNPKNVSKLSEKWSVMFIPDPDPIFPPSRIRILGSKKQRIPDPDPQHWFSKTGVPDTVQVLYADSDPNTILGFIVRNNFYFLIICFQAFALVKF